MAFSFPPEYDFEAFFSDPPSTPFSSGFASTSTRLDGISTTSSSLPYYSFPYNYAHINNPSIFTSILQGTGGSISSQEESKDEQSKLSSQSFDFTNIPSSTDPLFPYSGFTAGLMTSNTGMDPSGPFISGIGGNPPMGTFMSNIGMPGMPGMPILGPIQPSSANSNYSGLYSSSGFDILSILARIASRPNPQITIGPVDLSCSFLVVDARKYDFPIIYCSPTFEKLTGYSSNEIIGRNCRFLQAPDGHVALGSRRKYTDNAAVYHIKTHMMQGKECQASTINYRKGGLPFINLITIIPLAWESEEIEFFVGLQIDLVDQPNSIVERMKNGTYNVNYSLTNIPPYLPGNFNSEPVDDFFRDIPATTPFPASPEVFDLIGGNGDSEASKRAWNKMLLEHSDDFIHVLSLKGIFLYCSPSSRRMLEYEPDELVGRSLSTICHPCDHVSVMRELKESSNGADAVNFIYRIRRKNSGYMWIECQGKLHLEQGKGRKCVILTGRERPVYRLMWRDVLNASSISKDDISSSSSPLREASSSILSDNEFWSKLSLDGLYLYASAQCANVLGFQTEEIIGTSLYQLIRADRTTDVTRALSQARGGQTVNLRHHIQNKKGQYIEVISTFYPGDITHGIGKPSFIVLQTREFHAEGAHEQSSLIASPTLGHGVNTSTSSNSSSSSRISVSPGPGHLSPDYRDEENMFEELETLRSSSWQFELHQMRLANKKLREELEALMNAKRKKQKKRAPSSTNKICAHCQRRDSPEWRKGPNGPKELCNACGLRYAKSLSASGDTSSGF